MVHRYLPTVGIVEVGSMNMSLHRLAVNIFDSCVNNNIHLAIEWIPRTMNQKADMISKLDDTDDWQILSDFFILIDRLWGPHTVDCFATYYNKKINRFFSRYWNPGTFGVDAFFQSWKNENCLLAPPVDLVPQTLKYMEKELAVGTLIVPHWPSAVFWPLLWGRHRSAVIDYNRYEGAEVVTHGRNVNSIFGSASWPGHMYAIRLCFNSGLWTRTSCSTEAAQYREFAALTESGIQ